MSTACIAPHRARKRPRRKGPRWAVVPAAMANSAAFDPIGDEERVDLFRSRREAEEHIADFRRWAAEFGITTTPADRLVVRPVVCLFTDTTKRRTAR